MNSVVFSSKFFFKNAILSENLESHKLICEFDLKENMSIHDITSRLMENDGTDLYSIEYIIDGEVNKVYYGYIVIDSVEQIDTINEDCVRCKLILRYPVLDELIPILFRSLVSLNIDGESTNANIGGVYAQVTSDLRILMMDSLK